MLQPYIQHLQNQQHLSIDQSYDCLLQIFTGNCQNTEIKTLLTLIAQKGEDASELIGFAKAMRQTALKVHLNTPAIDIVGTGGSNKMRFNTSTAASFVLAAGGVPIAKHGNRGSSKPNGSFDFLESLGINFNLNPAQIQTVFAKTNMAFLFARNHHPAMKFVTAARKELATRTIFNLIGPLSNPASVDYQVIGATDQKIAKKLAQAVLQLGTTKTIIIAGAHQLDELSTTGDSQIFEVTNQKITNFTFNAKTIHAQAEEEHIKGADSIHNAALFLKLCQEKNTDHHITNLICLNAGAGFYCFGKAASIPQGFNLAKNIFASDAVLQKIEEYRSSIPLSVC